MSPKSQQSKMKLVSPEDTLPPDVAALAKGLAKAPVNFNVEEFIKKMQTLTTPEAVVEAFGEVIALPAAEAKAACAAIEKSILSQFGQFKDFIRDNGVDELKEMLQDNPTITKANGEPAYGDEALALVHTVLQAFSTLNLLRGNDASPLVAAYAAAAENLTDREYNNTTDCLVKPLMALVDAMDAEMKTAPLKPNPLRTKGPAKKGPSGPK